MTMHDPGYTLELKQSLTLKPKNFYVHAIPRNRSTSPIAVVPTSTLVGVPKVSQPSADDAEAEAKVEPKHKLYVAYGSNTGTSQTFAQRIASDAPAHGALSIVEPQSNGVKLNVPTTQASRRRWERSTQSRLMYPRTAPLSL